MMVWFDKYACGNLKVLLVTGGYFKREISSSFEKLADNVAYIEREYVKDLQERVKCFPVDAVNNNSRYVAMQFCI